MTEIVNRCSMMAKIYVRLQDWAEGESELVSENVEREKLCAEPEERKTEDFNTKSMQCHLMA